MYWCNDCEKVVSAISVKDSTGEYKLWCENCGSDDVEDAGQCEICGKHIYPYKKVELCSLCEEKVSDAIDESVKAIRKINEHLKYYEVRDILVEALERRG